MEHGYRDPLPSDIEGTGEVHVIRGVPTIYWCPLCDERFPNGHAAAQHEEVDHASADVTVEAAQCDVCREAVVPRLTTGSLARVWTHASVLDDDICMCPPSSVSVGARCDVPAGWPLP